MDRRGFLASGAAVGIAMTWPAHAGTGVERGASLWLVSRSAAADRAAAALVSSGREVLRVPDEPAALWYDHVAPGLMRGEVFKGLSAEGTRAFLEQFAHLGGRVTSLARPAMSTMAPGFEAWSLRPWRAHLQSGGAA